MPSDPAPAQPSAMPPAADGGELLRAADAALYQAKYAGRNRMSMAALVSGQIGPDAPTAA